MASRNQNKPPVPRNPVTKNRATDDGPLDKRRRVGTDRLTAATSSSRGRQALAPMNNQKDVPVAPSETEATETEIIEFTKEEVEALLNERFKPKTKFDTKAKQEWMTEYIKKLKVCIKWFQKGLQELAEEKDKLRETLDSSEKKCLETEAAMKNKEEELNAIISKLETKVSCLNESLAKEESEKLDALDSHKREKEARMASEKTQDSLREELGRAEQNLLTANEKVKTQEDMYKRLQEYNTSLQQYNTKLQNEVKVATDANKHLEKEKSAILENHTTLRGHYSMLQKEFTSAKESRDDAVKQKEAAKREVDILRGELQQVREDREKQLLRVQELTSELKTCKEYTGRTVAEIDNLILKSSALEDTCSSQREQISLLQSQLAAATQKLKMADMSSSEIRTEYEEQKRIVSDLQDRLKDAETKLLEGENLRKKLHNTILELKGNIRVFCRVRPLLPDDGPTTEATVSFPSALELAGRGIELYQSGQKYPFTFDKVFDHSATQQEVFMEISQLVQSALDGYKVCIFAYGQTGSGKTYTMMGRPDAPLQKGLIPRSLEQVFQTSQALAVQGWKYKMQASMLEIYNETIRDLLSPRQITGGAEGGGGAGKQYTIRHDADGNTFVSDLTIVDVCSIREVSSLLQQAAHNRSVGKTDMNEHSSRSHLVFTLRIYGVNESTEQQVQGVLNLIDLAGSERLSRSGATGERLKETQAINKSLSSLSDVIFALAKKEDHVPFRNSKLTYLLQPCLGGDSKTLMFVNVSPDPSSVGESLCSLRFAARVNSCEIGIPRRQTIKPLDSRLSCG
ncbi:putative minus-end-directed kinesin ATPase [Helianthus annuus]|uniref:Kinesin-like protein n=1 Tax=Helianthus annuus TaxID=4232 RepID=A0A251UMA9_HELAN|nr:kinesin-like protein KIN-14D [Helianthus annuus]XP_035846499.1 kinesin-like protein KIN-14D [Helianthus annuus]XP_035846500.1 kinesin-like protein KIN-14D [Helianthus annuus]KAF5804198.1 putative minus-end-directed kinesin ATPase [Helianthus annuus]KAJ0921129.1 putative minus-end-directed kinesin ATPase [Helianthus annuus]